MRYHDYSQIIGIYAMALKTFEDAILACSSKQETTEIYQELSQLDKDLRKLLLHPVEDQPDVPIVNDQAAMLLIQLLQKTLKLKKQLRASL